MPARLTLSITPVLAEQLGDPLVAQHFESYLLERAERAAQDVSRFERAGDLHARYLAHWYEDFYNRTLAVFRGRFNRDLVGAARRLQDSGHLEIAASAATHPYLPLLEPRVVGGGAGEHRRAGVPARLPRRPEGDLAARGWLPAAAVEELLGRALGLSLFFAETHALVGGRPVGKAMNDVVGPYASVPKRYLVPTADLAAKLGADDVPAVPRRAVERERARAQHPVGLAGLVDRARLSRRLRLPRAGASRRRLRPPLLARDRRQDRPDGEGLVPPGLGRGEDQHPRRPLRADRRGRRCGSTTSGPASTASWRRSATRRCSEAGGSRACAGSARCWRGWRAARRWSCARPAPTSEANPADRGRRAAGKLLGHGRQALHLGQRGHALDVADRPRRRGADGAAGDRSSPRRGRAATTCSRRRRASCCCSSRATGRS